MEDVVTNEDQDELTSLSSIAPNIILLNKYHIAPNLLNEFTYLLNEFSLNKKIIGLTTNNESAMTVLDRELGKKLIHEFHNNKFSHYRCVVHIINQSVKQGTFYMLTKFKKIETVIKMLIANHDELVEIFPNSEDSQHINDTLILLDLMEKATKLLSAALYLTMELIDEKCTISTILDPRYKLSDFEGEKRITAINTIQNVFHTYLQLNHNTTTTTSSMSNSQAPQNLHEYFAHLNDCNQNYLLKPLNSELDRYLQLVEDIGIDPLVWWSCHANEFPTLSLMAQDYLVLQATSVSCEQAFSIASNTITKKRNRLRPST
ncbi:5332_t:CDS:2, partial [Scutellospora calospora]